MNGSNLYEFETQTHPVIATTQFFGQYQLAKARNGDCLFNTRLKLRHLSLELVDLDTNVPTKPAGSPVPLPVAVIPTEIVKITVTEGSRLLGSLLFTLR